MSARRDALKSYIYTLFAEGTFKGLNSPGAIAKKVVSAFHTDLSGAVTDMANQVLASKVEQLAGAVAKRGLRSVWNTIQMQHQRGVERNRRRSSK